MRRGLVPVMKGRTIARADVNRPDLRWPLPDGMSARLTGQSITALRRRSKYILADLSGGETLLIHLGMSGRVLISDQREAPGGFALSLPAVQKHDHIVLHMQDGVRITYNDARRFGMWDLISPGQTHPMLATLGPEPLGNDFHADYLTRAFVGRKTPIKAALLDQSIIAGLGNIYVCEVLFRAGIAPTRLAGQIAAPLVAAMVPIIRDVLTEAIDAGGSSLRDYRQTDGELGYFQHNFRVYGREGHPCSTPGCTGQIARLVQSGRSSFYCPQCQR